MRKFCALYALTFLWFLVSCASADKPENLSAEEIYNTAFEDLEKTRYKKAAEGFEQVETEHPYSQWAVKSKLMGAYAYYKNEDYDDAVLALDRFIKYHPGNPDAPYAYYLKGICYYDQISAADKEQGDTEKAEEAFNRLIMLYPNSKYAEDARNKLKLTEDYKAGQEMIIGRYYLNNGNYLSALNRFNVVLEEYQTTVQIEEALYRQVEIYAILGMNRYAKGYYDILQKNYPKGEWTEKAANVMAEINDGKEKTEIKTEVPASGESAEKNEDNSWFGWLNFSNDDDENAEISEKTNPKNDNTSTVKPEEKATEDAKFSWFGWLNFSNDDDENAISSEAEAKDKVAAEDLKKTGNKAEKTAAVLDKKLQPSVSKDDIGDILKGNKGRK